MKSRTSCQSFPTLITIERHIFNFSAASELIVDLTFGYQSAPFVMPSGNGYFRQAELFLIPEYSYTGEDSY